MTTFVLIHGAWHGGWCWKKVSPILRKAGHKTYAPTLTGLGERSHLLSRDIDLNCHIQDVVNLLAYEELNDVILVGHSYAGMVITGVVDRCPERLSQLVYLDAFVPVNGQSALDIIASFQNNADSPGEEMPPDMWLIPAPSADALGVVHQADARWLEKHLTPHPLKSTAEKLVLTNKQKPIQKCTYISCTVDQEKLMPSMAKTAARIRYEKDWNYLELQTGHNAMVTAPEELAKMLLNLV